MALFEPGKKASKAISPDEMDSLASDIKKNLLQPGGNLFWKDEEMKKRLGRLEAALLKLRSSPAPPKDEQDEEPGIEDTELQKKINYLLEQIRSVSYEDASYRAADAKNISTDSINRELASAAKLIQESAERTRLAKSKYDYSLKLSARLLILLKYFKRNKSNYNFSREKYLVYRIDKKIKKPILEVYFPQDFKIFSDSHVSSHINEIMSILVEIIRLNQHLQSSSLHPAFKNKLEKENRALEHHHFVFNCLLEKNFKAAFEGKIEGYNNSSRELIPMLHEMIHTGLVIKMMGDEAPNSMPRSFGFLLYESGGFGDIMNTIKTYMSFKQEYPQHKHYLLYEENFVLDKVKKVFPELKPIHTTDVSVDVAYAFLRSVIPLDTLKAKLVIKLDEYDVYPRAESNELDFHFGFSEKGFGILPQLKYDETRQDVIEFLRKKFGHYSKERIPFEESYWMLKYNAGRPLEFVYENVLRKYAFTLVKPLILFVMADSLERYIDRIRKNFKTETVQVQSFAIIRLLSIDDKPVPKPVYIIFQETVPHNIFSKLIEFSDYPCIITGDQSLNEAINYRKPFLYLAATWKQDLLAQLIETLRNLGCSDVAKILRHYDGCKDTFPDTNPMTLGFNFNNIEPFVNLFNDKQLQARFSEALQKISATNISLKYLYELTLKRWKEMNANLAQPSQAPQAQPKEKTI